jgi:hypothetical protein
MEDDPPTPSDIEEFLERMRPPDTPDQSFDPRNTDLYAIRSWKRTYAASVLAGLSTEARFQANGVRIDWLTRLVLAYSTGSRKPNQRELSRALNEGLGQARVLQLEDPCEDIPCELVITKGGAYRIFMGLWEGAGFYTRSLIRAFESLPPSQDKDQILKAVHALLQISDEIARRANMHPLTESGGTEKGRMDLPGAPILLTLSERVKFSHAALNRIGVMSIGAEK